jgi:two-component system chemotaxis response regulator CheY
MAYNVLIVDDSPAMRLFVRRVVDISGIDRGACFEAGNGEEALAVLRKESVDVVLSDINMPVMDGEQFLRQMEEDEKLRAVPVIVVSTDRTETRVDRMISLGARGYITKPFLPQTLRGEIEKVLGVSDACN